MMQSRVLLLLLTAALIPSAEHHIVVVIDRIASRATSQWLTSQSAAVTSQPVQLVSLDSQADPLTQIQSVRSAVNDSAVAVVTSLPCSSSQLVTSLAQARGVAHVSLPTWPCAQVGTCDVTRWSARGSLVPAAVSVVRARNWHKVVVLFDNKHRYVVSALLREFSPLGVRASFINVSASDAVRERREALLHETVILMFCGKNVILELFREVRYTALHLLGPRYYWLIASYDGLHGDMLTPYLLEGDNVLFLTGFEKMRNASEVLPLVLDIVQNVTRTRKAGLCSHIQRAHPYLYDVNVTSLVVYDGGVRFSPVAVWSPRRGLSAHGSLFPQEHQGYNLRPFLVTTLPYPPFMVKHPNGSYSGICFELLEELARVLNFTYRIVEPADSKWGVEQEDGRFSGMIGQLQRKEVDLAVAHFAITRARQRVVDYTAPFWEDPNIILMKKPDLSTTKIFICLGPFSPPVWGCVVAAVIVAGFCSWFIRLLNKSLENRDADDVNVKDETCDLQMNLWQTYGAILQQGMVYIPESQSTRFMIAFWWCFTIIVVGTYNGNLIAFLTAPKVTLPIENLRDVVTSDLKIGTTNDISIHGLLKGATDGVYRDVWGKIRAAGEENVMVDRTEDGAARALRDGSYAFLLEQSFYDTLSDKDVPYANRSCDFARAKEPFFPSTYAFPMQKNSPYTQEFSINIMRVLEAGLMRRWKRKWYSLGNRCTGLESFTAQKTLQLLEAQGAFYILGLGLVLAGLLLAGECVLFTLRTGRPRPPLRPRHSSRQYTSRQQPAALRHHDNDLQLRAPSPRDDAVTSPEVTSHSHLNLATIAIMNDFANYVRKSPPPNPPENLNNEIPELSLVTSSPTRSKGVRKVRRRQGAPRTEPSPVKVGLYRRQTVPDQTTVL